MSSNIERVGPNSCPTIAYDDRWPREVVVASRASTSNAAWMYPPDSIIWSTIDGELSGGCVHSLLPRKSHPGFP